MADLMTNIENISRTSSGLIIRLMRQSRPEDDFTENADL